MSEIVLTLDTHRLDALEEVMQEQGGVEKYMQNLLIDLYINVANTNTSLISGLWFRKRDAASVSS